jgi:hypothetical protein
MIYAYAMLAVISLTLSSGCMGSQTGYSVYSQNPPGTSNVTEQTLTVNPADHAVLPASSSTLPLAEADKAALCREARANRTVYERCKMAASGNLALPQSELRRCAEIQHNAGAYSELIFHSLQNCAGIPVDGLGDDTYEGALFCKDMGQPARDQCYFSVRMCGQIEESDLRKQRLGSLELKKL